MAVLELQAAAREQLRCGADHPVTNLTEDESLDVGTSAPAPGSTAEPRLRGISDPLAKRWQIRRFFGQFVDPAFPCGESVGGGKLMVYFVKAVLEIP